VRGGRSAGVVCLTECLYDDPGEFQSHRDQHKMDNEWFLVGLGLLGSLATRTRFPTSISIIKFKMSTVQAQVILIPRLTNRR
jgi:hypothetical protein